jgi:hypothetical protein
VGIIYSDVNIDAGRDVDVDASESGVVKGVKAYFGFVTSQSKLVIKAHAIMGVD